MNAHSKVALSEIDGGPVKIGPSVFWHFQQSLEHNADREAVIVAHQRPNHLVELTGSNTITTLTSTTNASEDSQYQQNDDFCLRWTYRQLHNAGVRLVASLHKVGVPSGSRIVHLIPNSIEWCIILWACKLGKFTQSAWDIGLLTAPRIAELQMMLQTVEPDVVIVPEIKGIIALEQALEAMNVERRPTLKVVLSSKTAEDDISNGFENGEWLPFPNLALSAAPVSVEARSSIEANGLYDDMSRVSDIMFTSGTSTGKPKGCPRTVMGTLFSLAAHAWGPGCMGEQCKFNTTPYAKRNDTLHPKRLPTTRGRYALAGQNFRIIAPAMLTSVLAVGGTLIMPSAQPNPGALISAIPRFQVETILMIPPGVHAMAANPDFEGLDQKSLKAVLVGGDTVTQATFEKAACMFPNCAILASHGMTEGGGALYPPYAGRPGREVLADFEHGNDQSDAVIRFHAGIASIGKVNTGTCLRVADEQNKAVPRNEIGELHFSNPSMVRYYLNYVKPEDFYVDDCLDVEGHAMHRQWFKSGDLGIIDDDGWVWILGRKKDVIKRMGISVVPAALESCLNRFLNSETAVIPHPHSTLGQVPIAVVKEQALTTNNRSKADVEKQVVDLFGAEQALGGVVTLKEIGLTEFPLNATGKILKRELMEAVSPFLDASTKLSNNL